MIFLVVLASPPSSCGASSRRNQRKALERKQAELEPVRKLAFEDVTALGEELQFLDLELAGRQLDPGANADYQRALDEYEAAKKAADTITEPEHVKNVTEILEDARYAMACVPRPGRRPAAADPPPAVLLRPPPRPLRRGRPLHARRAAPQRDVPACALDAERVNAGAEPDIRKVMVGNRRVPYFQGGRAYQPYAAGYFGGFGPMDLMFMGMLFGGGFDGIGDGIGAIGEGLGDGIGSIGDGIGGMFDGIGDMFDGFDF